MDIEKNGAAPAGEERPSAEMQPSTTAGGEAGTGGEKAETQPPATREEEAAAAGTRPMQPASSPDATPPASSASWFGRHRLWAGIAMGVLAVLLLGGMFAIGYAVGRQGDDRPEVRLPRQESPWREMRACPPETPLQKFREERLDRLETLMACRGELAEFLAGELGVTVDVLEEELGNGKTVAELAEDKGVSVDGLVSSLAGKIEEIADRLVAEGELTSVQAERIKSVAPELASLLVRDGPRFFAPRPGRRARF
ncbi:MAG: hypothetical protein H5T73_03610 [Actinobacteria bacterium]|nr:hypothetical protein [Actinomycetota bacterium]